MVATCVMEIYSRVQSTAARHYLGFWLGGLSNWYAAVVLVCCTALEIWATPARLLLTIMTLEGEGGRSIGGK